MNTKTLNITIPDFLTVEQYSKMNSYEGESELKRMVHVISALTGLDKEEVQNWNAQTIQEIASAYADLLDHKQEFHSIIEWNGTLYGYSSLQNSSLGEYIDIENLTKDLGSNMHKLAAILYRPITSHRFKTLKFAVKQKIKMVNNSVENVFDWYNVEPYDNKKRKEREEDFKQFPIHILLGAVSFFLHTANQYSIDILYLQNKITKRMMEKMKQDQMKILSASIGAGGGLFTNSVNPIYYKLQGTRLSQT